MTVVSEPVPNAAATATPQFQWATVADLQAHFEEIPLERIRLIPPPGTATEQDVLAVQDRKERLCELVDGTLVEKTMGWLESRVAMFLAYLLESYLQRNDLGVITGEAGTIRLLPNQVRMPDLAFYNWDRFTDRRLPKEPLPAIAPDLAIEILSKSNTPGEMRRKLAEYFAAGTTLVWIIDPELRVARAYRSPEQFTALSVDGSLDGETVLPGFSIKLDELFRKAGIDK